MTAIYLRAIFSDDSDDEVETFIVNKAEDPEKKIEAASNTLSRLIAGDFLESLGKELGLEVPPDPLQSTNKDTTPGPHKELNKGNGGSANTVPSKLMSSSNHSAPGRTPANQQALHDLEVSEEVETQRIKHIDDNFPMSESNMRRVIFSEKKSSKQVDMEIALREDRRRRKSPSSPQQDLVSCSSSEDDRSRKHSRRQWLRSRDTYSDSSSSDHRGRYQSRSKRGERILPRKEQETAENTRNIVNMEVGTLQADPLIMARRKNMQKEREKQRSSN
ncbi:hypothetical protein HS088_TW16G00533 [Tripterygium wilfordii]|uniref:Uncharacterized protein n=1 Tax=Tripterygium wilfordii TaxID=458696 RepID=A0A7J7CJA9_TRIWF|nr:hypothetical protein HS088_TW16G00533 [Tripterygium wilfordii]